MDSILKIIVKQNGSYTDTEIKALERLIVLKILPKPTNLETGSHHMSNLYATLEQRKVEAIARSTSIAQAIIVADEYAITSEQLMNYWHPDKETVSLPI